MTDFDYEEFEKIMEQQKPGGDTSHKQSRDDHRNRHRQKEREYSRDREGRDNRDDRQKRDKGRDRDRSRDRDDSHDRRRDKKYRRESKQRYRSTSRSRDRKNKKYQPRDKSDKSSSQHRERRQRRDRQKGPEVQKDPYFKDRRQIQRVRAIDPRKAQQMQTDLQKRMIFQKKNKEVEIMNEKFNEAKKQLQEARRQDLTVLVHSLPLKAKEKDIWEFFAKQGCGKIADIRIIKDPKSNKSKGVSYVQFYTAESIQKALLQSDKPFQCNGRVFQGLKVMHSQAQKNRAAAAARNMRIARQPDPFESNPETIRRSTKVVVGGLVDRLADIDQERLKELFRQFGQIDYIDIHRDPLTGRCKGYAFIQYTHVQDAKAAVKAMNGLQVIKGHPIKVSTISVTQRGDPGAMTHDDQYIRSDVSKTQLMDKFGRGPTQNNISRPPISTVSTQYLLMPSMFTLEGKTPAFFDDLKREVQEMCSKFGTVQKLFVEKNNQGNIWIKYSDTQSAVKAQETLSTQYFDNKKVFCYHVTEHTYQSRVGN